MCPEPAPPRHSPPPVKVPRSLNLGGLVTALTTGQLRSDAVGRPGPGHEKQGSFGPVCWDTGAWSPGYEARGLTAPRLPCCEVRKPCCVGRPHEVLRP